MRLLLVIAILAAAVGIVLWTLPGAPPPLITDARAVPVKGAPHNVMVTLNIDNPGGPDRLTDVRAAAKSAVVKAPDATGLTIPAGSTPSLAMEAGHIMLMGLPDPATEGTLIPLTLVFETAGEVAAKARVAVMAMDHRTLHEVAPDAAPSVALSATPDGDGWLIRMETAGLRLAQDLVDQPHQPGTGHAHLYLQGTKIARVFTPEIRIGALPPGAHRARVVLATNDHRTYAVNGQPIAAETVITQP